MLNKERQRKEGRKAASYRDGNVTVVVQRCPVLEKARELVSSKRLSQPASQQASQPASKATLASEPASSCFIQSGS